MGNPLQKLPLNSGIDPRQIYAALYGQQIDPAAAAQQPPISPGMTVDNLSKGAPAPPMPTQSGMNLYNDGGPGLQNPAPTPALSRAGELSSAFQPSPTTAEGLPAVMEAGKTGAPQVPNAPGLPSSTGGAPPSLQMPPGTAMPALIGGTGTDLQPTPRNELWDRMDATYGTGGHAKTPGPPAPPIPPSRGQKIMRDIAIAMNPLAAPMMIYDVLNTQRAYQQRLQEWQRNQPAVQEQADIAGVQHAGEITEGFAKAKEAEAAAGQQTVHTGLEQIQFEQGQRLHVSDVLQQLAGAFQQGTLPPARVIGMGQMLYQNDPILQARMKPEVWNQQLQAIASGQPTQASMQVAKVGDVPASISWMGQSWNAKNIDQAPLQVQLRWEAEQQAYQTGRAAKRTDEGYVSSLAAQRSAESQGRAFAEQERLLQLRQDQLTAPTRTMMEAAPLVKNLAAQTEQLLDKQEAQLGPLAGRWNDFWTGKVGAPNPEFKALQVNTSLLRTQLMKMHVGSRGSEFILREFANMLDAGKDSPENLRAALQTVNTYADSLIAEHQAADANLAGAISSGRPSGTPGTQATRPGGIPAPGPGGIQVQTNDNMIHSFPDQKSADAFRQAAKAKGLL